jgi:hypothetical protein
VLDLRSGSARLARYRRAGEIASELDVYQADGALADALFQRRDTARNRAVERQLASSPAGSISSSPPEKSSPCRCRGAAARAAFDALRRRPNERRRTLVSFSRDRRRPRRVEQA